MRRTAWHLAVPLTLLVLLGVLGTLQYRWVGDVSNAERDRLRNSLRTRAADFSRDFDREITRTYLSFQIDLDQLDRAPADALATAYERAEAASPVGGVVKEVYVVDAAGVAAAKMHRFDAAAHTMTEVEWPAALGEWRQRLERTFYAPGGHVRVTTERDGAIGNLSAFPPALFPDAIEEKIPALIVPIPRLKRVVDGNRLSIVGDPGAAGVTLFVTLDSARLIQLLETLAARRFGSSGEADYIVRVIRRDQPSRTLFATVEASTLTPENADVSTGLFDLRLDELNALSSAHAAASSSPGALSNVLKDRVAITIVRRAEGPEGARVVMTGGEHQGAWQVLVRHRSGSLEALVARSRNRNLAIGLGVLGLLAISFVFVIGSAQRQRRLAQQQMEFVATVSHELRTPLAVIRSASENLADGVVADGDQVKRYGTLIGTEGRRLSDMVERVMEFAGISAGTVARTRTRVDVAEVVDEAVRRVAAEARERHVDVVMRADAALPAIDGDHDALRSAIENVIGNAVKYSQGGSTVDVEVTMEKTSVRIEVRDRGIGIEAADLSHVFKPFYRGRRAVDAQIRGTGIGLSVVRHVVDAHAGDIRIEHRDGGGTTVVITLPAAEVFALKPAPWARQSS